MATQTTNLGLTKPAGADYVQISDFNSNSDLVDAAIGKLAELRTNVKTSLVAAINEAMISGGTDSPYINSENGHWMQWNNTLLKFEDTGVTASGSMWYNGTAITGTSPTAAVFATGITFAHVGDLYLNTQTSLVYWCAKEGDTTTATWRYLCSIKGAQGIQGNTGPTGTTFTPAVNSQGIISWSNDGNKPNPPSVSIKGPKGEPGTGLDIRGTYATLAELQAAVQSPQQGWMYNVGTQAPYRVYMYDSSNGWLDQGQLQGPTGSTGKSAYNAAVEGGYQGNEDTFNAQMAAIPTHISNTDNPHSVTKEQVGLGNLANERQYSQQNPPPYPVKSVNGQTGDVEVSSPQPSTTLPKMNGTANAGSEGAYSPGDHVHPTDTTRQGKITASGILKGSGDGVVVAATPDVDYSTPAEVNRLLLAEESITVDTTIYAADWAGTESPYSQVLFPNGGLPGYRVDVYANATLLNQMLADNVLALYTENVNGTVTLYAVGNKPSTDISIQYSYQKTRT